MDCILIGSNTTTPLPLLHFLNTENPAPKISEASMIH